MNLSAFGVESDGFPYIQATIDFTNDTSICKVSYDNPKFKDSIYRLTQREIDTIKYFIYKCDFSKLKKEYTVGPTDEPTSTIIIYTSDSQIEIKDYALQGEFPLKEFYRIVYKLDFNFR